MALKSVLDDTVKTKSNTKKTTSGNNSVPTSSVKVNVSSTPTVKTTAGVANLFTPTSPKQTATKLTSGVSDALLPTKQSTNNAIVKDALKLVQDSYAYQDIRDNYSNDVSSLTVNKNTKFRVNDVTSSTYLDLQKKLENGTASVYVIKDGNSLLGTSTALAYYTDPDTGDETPYTRDAQTVGRQRLFGITDSDKYVIYDSETGNLYKYGVSESVNDKREQLDNYNTALAALNKTWTELNQDYTERIDAYDEQLQTYVDLAEANDGLTEEQYAQYQALYAERTALVDEYNTAASPYIARMQRTIENRNRLSTELDDTSVSMSDLKTYAALTANYDITSNLIGEKKTNPLLTTTKDSKDYQSNLTDEEKAFCKNVQDKVNKGLVVYADEDWIAQMDSWADSVTAQISDYQTRADALKITSSYYDQTEVNSMLDVLKRQVSREVTGQFSDTTALQDIKDYYYSRYVLPISVANQNGISITDTLKTYWVNALVALGEDMDFTNALTGFIWGTKIYEQGISNDPDFTNWFRAQVDKEYAAKYGKEYTEEDLTAQEQLALTIGGVEPESVAKDKKLSWIAGMVATKAALGFYGEEVGTHNAYSYTDFIPDEDQNLATTLMGFATDIAFDPGTYFGIDLTDLVTVTGTVKLEKLTSKVSNETSDELIKKSIRKAGINLSDEHLDEIAKELQKNVEKQVRRYIRDAAVITKGDGVTNLGEYITQAYMKTTSDALAKAGISEEIAKSVGTHSNEVTKQLAHKATDNVLKNVRERARNTFSEQYMTSSMKKLATDTTRLANTVNTINNVTHKVNKAIMCVSMPALAAIYEPAKYIFLRVRKSMSEEAAKTAMSIMTQNLTKIQHIIDKVTTKPTDNALEELMQVIESFGSADKSVKLDAEDLNKLSEYEIDTYSALVNSIIEARYSPIKNLMSSKRNEDLFAALDKYAQKNGYKNFDELFAMFDKEMNTIYKNLSTSAYSTHLRVKADLKAAKLNVQLATFTKTIEGYLTNSKTILKNSEQIVTGTADITMLKDTVNALNLMHEAYRPMLGIGDEAMEATYKTSLATLQNDLIHLIDNDEEAQALTDEVFRKDVFRATNAINDYAKSLKESKDLIIFKSYGVTDLTEFRARADELNVPREYSNVFAQNLRNEYKSKANIEISPDVIRDKAIKKSIDDLLNKGVDLSSDEAQEVLGKFYIVTLGKYNTLRTYLDDAVIERVNQDLLTYDNATAAALNGLGSILYRKGDATETSAFYAAVSELRKSAAAFECSKAFNDFVEENAANFSSQDIVNAVLDNFAGNTSLNIFSENYVNTGAMSSIDKAVDSITNGVQDYLDQTSKHSYDYMWTADGKQMNTINTATNVEGIAEYAANHADLLPQSDEFIDVYFSLDAATKNSDAQLISFRYGDKTITIKDNSAPFVTKSDSSMRMYNVSANTAMNTFTQLSTDEMKVCNKQSDYLKAVSDYINVMTGTAKKDGKRVRFVGFNCGSTRTGHEMTLRKMLTRNSIPLGVYDVVDLADLTRHANRINVVDNNDVQYITMAVKKAFNLAKEHASRYRGIISNVVFDTKQDYSALWTTITQLSDKYSADSSAILKEPAEQSITSYNNIANRMYNISDGVTGNIVSTEVFNRLGYETAGVKNANLNLMRASKDALLEIKDGKVIHRNANLKKLFDTNLVRDWFDTDTINRLISESDDAYVTMQDMMDIVKKLNSNYANIYDEYLINSIGYQGYKTVFDSIVVAITASDSITASKTLTLLSETRLTTLKDLVAATNLLYTDYRGAFTEKFLEQLQERYGDVAKYGNYMDAWESLSLIDRTNASTNRTWKETPIIYNSYSHDTDAHRYTDMLWNMRRTNQISSGIQNYCDTKEFLLRNMNKVSPEEQINFTQFSKVSEPYFELVNYLNIPSTDVPIRDDFASDVAYASACKEFNASLDKYNDELKDMYNTHTATVISSVLELPPDGFYAYLIHHCKNNLVIDPTSSLFRDNKQLLSDTVTKLISLEKNGTIKTQHYKTEAGKDLILVYTELPKEATAAYKDNLLKYYSHVDTGFTKVYLDKLSKHTDKYTTSKLFDYMTQMQEYVPEDYYASMFSVMSEESYKNLSSIFPEEAQLGYDGFNSWFDEAYFCSVWADPDTVRLFNPYASGDIINSMAVGLHQVRNKMEGTSNLLSLFTDRTQQLSYILDASKSMDASVKDIEKQLNNSGYCLATIKVNTDKAGNATFKPIKVTLSDKLLKEVKANQANVICISEEMYKELATYTNKRNNMARFINDPDMLSKASQRYKINSTAISTVRSAVITSQLFLSNLLGTGVRNIIGSTYNAINDAGFAVLPYMANASELIDRYDRQIQVMLSETGSTKVNSELIEDYYIKHVDDAILSRQEFLNIHAAMSSKSMGFNELNGVVRHSSDLTPKEKSADSIKQWCTKTYDVNIADDQIKIAKNIYDEAWKKYRYMPVELSGNNINTMYEYVAAEIDKQIEGEERRKALKDAFYHYNRQAFTGGEWVEELPLINYIVRLNEGVFQRAEERARIGLNTFYMDWYGDNLTRSNKAVTATQFDYSVRPKWLENVELFLPFSTYSLYNAKYWLEEATKKPLGIKAITKITADLTDPYYTVDETQSIVRNMVLRQLYLNGYNTTDTEDDEESNSFFKRVVNHITDDIESYNGVDKLSVYAEGLGLTDEHFLKTSNTFLDAIKLLEQAALNPIGLITDKLFAPFAATITFLTDIKNGEIGDDLAAYLGDNIFDIMSLVPVFGQLASLIYSSARAANADYNEDPIDHSTKLKLQTWFALLNKEFRVETMAQHLNGMLDLIAVLFPSMIGTYKNGLDYYSKPIADHWDEYYSEYNQTHRYLIGYTNMPSFITKDPQTYVNYKAMFMSMGFTEDEAYQIMQHLFSGEYSTDNPYYSYKLSNGKLGFNYNHVYETLESMINKGYTLEEAIDIISSEDMWCDPETDSVKAGAQVKQDISSSAIFKIYDLLPDYVKYGDSQYSNLLSYWKSQGCSTSQAWVMMIKTQGYIDETGKFRRLTQEQAANFSAEINEDYYEFLNGLPNWYHYETGAANRTVKYLKEKYGWNTTKARNYIVSNNFYVDEDGNEHYFTVEESAAKDEQATKEFYEYYNQLPDYIKYEKGAYGRTLAYLKKTGLDTETAKEWIKDGAYYTEDGRLINCKGLTRTRYYSNKYANNYKKYVPRPKSTPKVRTTHGQNIAKNAAKRGAYVMKPFVTNKSYSSTYSKVDVLKGASYGYRQLYKQTTGTSPVRRSQSTASCYPAAYRNIVFAYRHNMYKDMYAKYGASRMMMRANASHSYSNASITRLRRNDIFNRIKYDSKRSRF